MQIQQDRYYRPAEVASFLGCGKTNVYDLIAHRDLACTRIGAGNGGVRVKGSALLEFLASRTEGGPTPKGKFKYLRKLA